MAGRGRVPRIPREGAAIEPPCDHSDSEVTRKRETPGLSVQVRPPQLHPHPSHADARLSEVRLCQVCGGLAALRRPLDHRGCCARRAGARRKCRAPWRDGSGQAAGSAAAEGRCRRRSPARRHGRGRGRRRRQQAAPGTGRGRRPELAGRAGARRGAPGGERGHRRRRAEVEAAPAAVEADRRRAAPACNGSAGTGGGSGAGRGGSRTRNGSGSPARGQRGGGGNGRARQGSALRLATGTTPGRGTSTSLGARGGSGKRASGKDGGAPSAAIRTIETVVKAVPTAIWIALGVLSLLALALAGRTYVERRNARALARDREQLRGDVAALERALLRRCPIGWARSRSRSRTAPPTGPRPAATSTTGSSFPAGVRP